MTSHPSDEGLIAARLTDAQWAALLELPRIGSNNPARRYIRLCELGLADCTIKGDEEGERWFVIATPLGMAIRALKGNPHV